MFAPPGIGLGDPKRVETSVFAGFGHGDRLADRLHAELQNSDVKGDGHENRFWLLASGYWLLRIFPRMFQAFDQRPHGSVKRGGHSNFLTPLHDSAVHEIDFSLALGEDILQHTRAVLSRRVSAFLHQATGIAVEFDPQLLRNRFTFGNQIVRELSGGFESGGGAMMKQSQRADWIRRG